MQFVKFVEGRPSLPDTREKGNFGEFVALTSSCCVRTNKMENCVQSPAPSIQHRLGHMAKSRLRGDKQRATERERERARQKQSECRVWVNNIEIKRWKGKIHKKPLVWYPHLKLQLAVTTVRVVYFLPSPAQTVSFSRNLCHSSG